MINALNILGQIIFGGYFIYSGLNHFIHSKDYSIYAASMKVPMPTLAVFATGLLMLLGGIGILFNIYVEIAIVLLLIFLIPTTFTMHPFWKAPNIAEKAAQKIQFFKNFALIGALLLLF